MAVVVTMGAEIAGAVVVVVEQALRGRDRPRQGLLHQEVEVKKCHLKVVVCFLSYGAQIERSRRGPVVRNGPGYPPRVGQLPWTRCLF